MQNVSVQRNVLRFSAIFLIFEIKPEMQDVFAKNAGLREISQKGDFPHDCGTVDTYENIQLVYKIATFCATFDGEHIQC